MIKKIERGTKMENINFEVKSIKYAEKSGYVVLEVVLIILRRFTLMFVSIMLTIAL